MASRDRITQRYLYKSLLLFFLLSGLSAASALAFDRVTLDRDTGYVNLGDRVAYLEDRQGKLTFEDIRSASFAAQWLQSQEKIPAFGFTASAYWFAVDLENLNQSELKKLLEISYSLLDSVDIFLDRGIRSGERVSVGDRYSFGRRPIEHRHFVIPVNLRGHERVTLYIRVQTSSAMQVPVALWAERQFWLADQQVLLVQGLYFGAMLVMIVYNLFLYAAVRDRSYVFYVLFASCFTVVQLALHGFSFHYFWPEHPRFNEKILVISVCAAYVFGGLFANSLLGLKFQSVIFYRLFTLVVAAGIVNALVSLVVPYEVAIKLALGMSLIICLLSLAAGCMMWHRGYTPARYYTIAWAAFLVGTVIFVLNKLSFIPRTLFTENAMQVTAVTEVILLSFALANRINVAYREKHHAQAASVALLEKYRTLYENAIEGIFQITLECDVVSANLAMMRMLGLDEVKAPIHRPVFNLRSCFADENAADEFFRQLSEDSSEVIGYEFTGKSQRDCEFWGLLSARTVFGDDGQPVHYEGSMVDITERRQAEERIRYLAYYDNVTGLPNRTLLQEHIKHTMDRAKRNKQSVAVLFVDLNGFKHVNDTLGHNAGDQLLREVAVRLNFCLRGDDWIGRPRASIADVSGDRSAGDTVARLGGDEFVMVLSDIRDAEDAAVVARRVGDVLAQSFVVDSKEVYVTASIGISSYPIDGDSPALLLKKADTAMYHAKKSGGNAYQFCTDAINAYASKRLTLETDLRNALTRDQFVLFYQPKVDLRTGQINGMEALCRWRHPERGMISPDEFIPLAEETGLIVPLGEEVLRAACEQNKIWQSSGHSPLRVSVNLSSRQFNNPELPETISRVLDETGLDAAYLEVELTESVLMDDTELTGKTLAELKKMGLYVSIDDFGTGYSSLSYLKRFSVDVLKIDRCFIHDITEDTDNQAITSAIISMARQLSLKVIAEGVETPGQLDYLRASNCDEIQGYLVSAPIPGGEITKLLQTKDLFLKGEASGQALSNMAPLH